MMIASELIRIFYKKQNNNCLFIKETKSLLSLNSFIDEGITLILSSIITIKAKNVQYKFLSIK